MAYRLRPIARIWGGVAVGASVACLLSSTAGAAAASCTNTPDGVSVVVASQSGSTLSPACVTQQGNVLIIVLPQNATGSTLPTLPAPTVQPTPVSLTPIAPIVAEGDMSNVVDPRINSYAKRQAIRDQYRGQIDEVTFNDELGDGVPVDSALADAMAAFNHPRS